MQTRNLRSISRKVELISIRSIPPVAPIKMRTNIQGSGGGKPLLRKITVIFYLFMIAAAIALFPNHPHRLLQEVTDSTVSDAIEEEGASLLVVNAPTMVVSDDKAESSHTKEQGQANLDGMAGLRAIVVGLEHSGTTIVSQVMLNAPCAIGASETGFLIADSPADIGEAYPWVDWNQVPDDYFMYRLKPRDIEAMKKAKDFPDMIDILRHRSPLFNKLSDEPYCHKPYQMIDKTPKYIYPEHFAKVLEKTPGVRVVVLKKPFGNQLRSWARRGHVLSWEFYNNTFVNVEKMMEKYPNRIMIVDYDKFKREPESVMQEVFEFTGLSWDPDYLKMTGLKKKFSNYPEEIVLDHTNKWAFKNEKHSPDLETGGKHSIK